MLRAATREELSQVPDMALIGQFQDGGVPASAKKLCSELADVIQDVLKQKAFEAKAGTSYFFHHRTEKKMIAVCLLGLGKKKDYSLEKAREAAAKGSLLARSRKAKEVILLLESFIGPRVNLRSGSESIAEAIQLSLYTFKNYKKESQTLFPKSLSLIVTTQTQSKDVKKGIEAASAIALGVETTRNLVNEPSNKMNPKIFSEQVVKLGKDVGFKVKVLEKKDLIKEKMGALLAVGQGSHIPPRLLVLTYEGRKTGAPTCLVGKGVTFDTGGISLKPAKGMEKMKYDMAGGGAVVGALTAIAKLKLPIKVVGVVPLTENMPGGGAIKPGDVITAASGHSIEILNTDAEGRLILADALHYAKRFKPKAVYDMATLTGAVIMALGSRCIGAMGDSELIKGLQRAGDTINERVWELPMFKEYDSDLKSDVADIQNIGAGEAGAIMGAKFLEKFVDKAYPWVHLDIAGTAWVEKNAPSYCPKGARGIGVRLLVELLRNGKR